MGPVRRTILDQVEIFAAEQFPVSAQPLMRFPVLTCVGQGVRFVTDPRPDDIEQSPQWIAKWPAIIRPGQAVRTAIVISGKKPLRQQRPTQPGNATYQDLEV
jgi:hypothetical protein